MAHVYRFFGERLENGRWRLDEDEVTHALKVLRLEDGADIEMTDGAGGVASGKLKIESKSKALAVDTVDTVTPRDPLARIIMIGALKGNDIDELIAPLVELGIDEIMIFRQDDTPHFRVNDNSRERWQRLVRSAVKQSKRPWMIRVEAFESLASAIEVLPVGARKWVLSPDASVSLIDASGSVSSDDVAVVALIGGEKGLSPKEELLAADKGFEPVKLGPWILRARTAAPAAAVFLGMIRHSAQ